jgi:hypothetical protein
LSNCGLVVRRVGEARPKSLRAVGFIIQQQEESTCDS